MNKLRTIHLEGKLKEVCGGQSTVQLVGNSMTILVNGLASMFGQEVKTVIKENNWQIFLDEDKVGDGLHESHVNSHLMDTNDIFLYPSVEGAGKVGNIILGIIMIVVGIIIIVGSWGTMTPAGIAAMANGAMMIVGGVMTIITALNTPNSQKDRGVSENPSFIFNGAANVIEQGGAVPCVYGRFRTGSTVVSAGIDSEQLTVYTSPTSGNIAGDESFARYNLQ